MANVGSAGPLKSMCVCGLTHAEKPYAAEIAYRFERNLFCTSWEGFELSDPLGHGFEWPKL